MFSYFARLHQKYALPVYPIVVFSFEVPQRSEPDTYRVAFPAKVVLDFNYAVIQLNCLNWREFLQQPNPVAAALMARMQIQPADRPKVKAECLRLLATLHLDPARMQLISGFIDTYLRLNAAEEKLFQQELSKIEWVEQEQIMEIVTSWMEQGIQQGLQRGKQEGKQEGKREGKQEGKQEEALLLILRQLTRRIGAVEPGLQKRIHSLSIAQLEELAEALLDFSVLADLQTWLSCNAKM